MRLLHTTTLQFLDIYHDNLPPYAILSHRWGEEEPSYQDFLAGRDPSCNGYRKVIDACRIAASWDLEYIWIDTVCIDKKSSAELSEAINSMFNWYKRATKCLVFLADVPSEDLLDKSAWFGRGWTLQELIAPNEVIFLNSGWQSIGTKSSLAPSLSGITGIDSELLRHPERLPKFNAAQKMSWASRRECTRGEDIAYCLLGIFDVNMSLLYGEGGQKAFFRLQLEIIRNNSDDSIFAWATPGINTSGMLAQSPADFKNSWDIKTFTRPQQQNQRPWTWTNLGLELWLPDLEAEQPLRFSMNRSRVFENTDDTGRLFGRDVEIFVLNCWKSFTNLEHAPLEGWRFRDRVVKLRLKRHGPSWRRVNCNEFLLGLDADSIPIRSDNVHATSTQAQRVTYRLVYVLGDPRGINDTTNSPSEDSDSRRAIDEAWQRSNLLTLDGGDFRSYWSLLALKKLVECIVQEEEDHFDPHYHSSHPEPFTADLSKTASSAEKAMLAHYSEHTDERFKALQGTKRFSLCHYFDFIGGAGFGGLIAIMLGRLHMTIYDCISAFEEMLRDVFWAQRSIAAEVTRRYGRTPKYDADKLAAFVRKLCSRYAQSSNPPWEQTGNCKTFVTAIESFWDKDTLRNPRVFRSYRIETKEDFTDQSKLEVWQVVAAATASPGFLKFITLEQTAPTDSLFEIGGFNFPSNPTEFGMQEIKSTSGQGQEGTIVSIGTAGYSIFNPNSSDFFSDHLATVQMQQLAEKDGLDYYRFNPDVNETMYHVVLEHPDEWEPKPSSKGEPCGSKTMRKVQAAFDRWLANPDVQNHFIECAQALVARRRLRLRDADRWAAYVHVPKPKEGFLGRRLRRLNVEHNRSLSATEED